jgi:hypothetical protein
VVEGVRAGCADLAEQRAHALDERVGRRLDVEVDRLPTLRVVGDPQPGVGRVEPLDGGAVGAVDERLGGEPGAVDGEPEVDHGLDGAAGPLGRDRPRQVEPARAPRRAPRLSHPGRAEGRLQRLGDGDRLAGGVPDLDPEGDGRAVDRRSQPLAQDALDAPLDQDAVVVHAGTPRRAFLIHRVEQEPRFNALMRQY